MPPLSQEESQRLIKEVEGWELVEGGSKIRRGWTAKNFMAGIDFFNKVAALAEDEGHHPDLHLQGLPERVHRDHDPRGRRAHRERLHPGGEDQRDPDPGEEVSQKPSHVPIRRNRPGFWGAA